MQFSTALLALMGSSLASAHMEMSFPPPFKSKFNEFAKAAGDIDSDMTSPLSASGTNYPCKGYQSLLGTAEGASVVTFTPGSTYNFSITGGAYHDGGSCQASLSYDKGKSFTVIQSIQGECPTAEGGSFDFTVPADAPTGDDVLFAWTWFNEVGNREMYMNCASVTIGAASKRAVAAAEVEKRATAFASRPAVFEANIGNGCGTDPSTDVIFPNPGPDVVNNGDKLAKPTGTCVAATGSDSGTSSGSSTAASAPAATSTAATTSAAAATSPAAVTTTPAVSTSAAAAVTSTTVGASAGEATSTASTAATLPGGVFVTVPTTAATSAAASSAAAATSTVAASSAAAASSTVAASSAAAASSTVAASSVMGTAPATTLATSILATGTSAAQPTTTASTGSSSGSGSSMTPGSACSNEGDWNCVDGTAFQRCASGIWSIQISMASGTKCQPGEADTLVYARRKGRTVRMAGAVQEQWA